MKAGQYVEQEALKIAEVPIPILEDGEALIKVSHTGICGTDMMIYFGKHPRAKAPLTIGHEMSGLVEIVNGISNFAKGDSVVVEPTLNCGECDACQSGLFHVCEKLQLIGIDMDGGFAEYVKVPIHRLHKIPENLSLSVAALAEPTAVAVHTVRSSHLQIGESVAVLGAGPIGLLIGLIARQNGASKVFVSDISKYRLKVAEDLGLYAVDANQTDVVKEIISQNNGKQIDVVYEVAGTNATLEQSIDLTKTKGLVVVVSVFKNRPTMDLQKMHYREISLTTTRCYTSKDFRDTLSILLANQNEFASIISHELSMDEIEEGFQLMKNPNRSLKVLIKQG